MKTATRPASGRAEGHVPEDQVSAQHRRGKKPINKHRSQSRTNDMLQNNRVGGWEDLSRKSSVGVLRVGKQKSDKEAQNKPRRRARTGPGLATWLRLLCLR